MDQRQEYVVMFPFMAQGHIIPFLALAHKILQTRGYSIVFINTPSNIKKLKASSSSSSFSSLNRTKYPSIQFLEVPFNGVEHGLPPGTENTDSLPYHLILKLLEASLTLKPYFKNLVSDLIRKNNGQKPLCVISDIFFAWSGAISKDLGVLHALFSGGGGFGFACYYSLWSNLPHRKTGSDEFVLPDFPEASRIHVSQLAEHLRVADGRDSFSGFQRKILPQWKDADGMLFNTVEGLDTKGLNYFRRTLDRPAWPIGPLLLSRDNETGAMSSSSSPSSSPSPSPSPSEKYMNWLDQKPVCSVLYISFGSQNTISPSQMMQLAIALEKSGKDFMWVVRPPVGFDINSEFRSNEWLPQGYEERIKYSNKGLLLHRWASQVEILKHKSVSAFLSHCGWNSVLEALCHGVPILAWPLAAEQFYNAKLLEDEIRVCVEVARGKSCEVRNETIVEKIELVMSWEGEKGREMRRKAKEVKEIMENAGRDDGEGFKGSSVKAMDDFLNAALAMKEKTPKA